MNYAEQDQDPQRPAPGKSILIVDDNATNRKLLREVLLAEGYPVVEAEDGLEALTILERKPVDIVVCDVLMPNMDGYTLCSEVRRRTAWKDLYFILYTAVDFTADDEKLGMGLGADNFIAKQGSPLVILKIIAEASAELKVGHSERAKRLDLLPQNQEMKKYSALMVRQLESNSIELEQARSALYNLNESLEKRVGERTAQLETANRELAAFNSQLEQRVAERTSELAAKNSDLELFASVASHDLQEPLRAVAGCIQIFERKYRGQIDEKGHEVIRMIVDGSSRMKALIDGLLAYSTAGKHEKLEIIDTGLILKEVLTDLSVAIAESQANIVFGELPSVRFVRGQLGQVLQNLIGNAIKYRGAATPKIDVRAERETDGWLFCVADNGIGFEPQYTEQIFGVFQRLHTRDQYAGTGIGLAIGKRIIERRGGKIWVESKPGHGSTFFFSIPDKAVELESISTTEQPGRSLRG